MGMAMGVASAGMGMVGQMQAQDNANKQAKAQHLQAEHQKQLQADRSNEEINRNMQKSIKGNSQIADYSLDQLISSSQAVNKQHEAGMKAAGRQYSIKAGAGDASSDSRNISADSGTARAIARQELQDQSDTMSGMNAQAAAGMEQAQEQRKQQLSQRDDTYFAPVNFAPSAAPTPVDNSMGIIMGGMLNMAGGFFGS